MPKARGFKDVAHRSRRQAVGVGAVLALGLGLIFGAGSTGAAVPSGFQQSTVFSGLTQPTAVRFAADGRVFVAEKSGQIEVFDNLADPTPTLFADLNVNVYNFWDRGLLGLALAPNFPADPHVYVLYSYDAEIGRVAPRWGTAGVLSDPCPDPPGATTGGCVVSGRLSRLEASGNVMTGGEDVLIEDWCQQYPSHSIGSLAFGADGALYASGGEGASFTFTDYGQEGSPLNPCGDPPGGVGATLSPPAAEGGALRSQDLKSSGDPVTLGGTIIRVDPVTGAGKPDNPLASSTDPNAKRIIAMGFRNPFRFTIKPGTNEVWAGDVGWYTWEEIDRLGSPTDPVVDNFGWPCYEGVDRQPSYEAASLDLCENFYAEGAGAAIRPHYTYNHNADIVPGDGCAPGSSSISGLAFYTGGAQGNYPATYDGGLFFGDYSRNCIWFMKKGVNGVPDPAQISAFATAAAAPVDLEIGPGGDLYYADFDGGTIRRIRYLGSNQPPAAVAKATPTSGPTPLTVNFDGTASSDPEGGALTYTWDLDDNGVYGDSTAAKPTFTYTQARTYTVRLRVTDPQGATAETVVIVTAGNNTPPVPTISTPAAGAEWKVGELINFSGSATDQQDGNLPASALSWEVVLHHCPSNCHTHPFQSFPGVQSGSFSAPDHDYPAYLELRLTATDNDGAKTTTSLRLNPKTVDLTFQSNPAGLQLSTGAVQSPTPFKRTVIVGSSNSISAPTPQSLGASAYSFVSWSDGGAQTHNVVAPAAPATYTATYESTAPLPVAAYSFDENGGTAVGDSSGSGNGGTIAGPIWTAAGKFGSALSFDGVNDWVTIADANSLDLTTGMTLEAWVKPSSLGSNWRTVLMKEQTGNIVYDLYANRSGPTQVPLAEVFAGGSVASAIGAAALGSGVWTHLAATYDGATLSLYVNGTRVATQPLSGPIGVSTGPLRIGGNSIWSEWFQGVIDEVRIYNLALTQAEIQTDMNRSVGTPDTTPPSAPANLSAAGSLGQSTLSWTAASDNVGVKNYNVHRSTSAGFVPSAANRIAQPTGTGYTDSGLAAGTYYYRVTAEDTSGNVGPASNESSATVSADTTPPSAPTGLTATAGPALAVLSWTAASDNVGVKNYNVHRSTSAGFVPSAANRIAQPTGTGYTDSGLAAGTYYYRVTAEDTSGNVGPASNESSATVTTTPPAGLVAALAFDENGGTAVGDSSGSGNGGTIAGPIWTAAGKFGSALSFDGVNDWVTIADANSLDLTTGMTLEAWVYPTNLGTGWRTVLFKEQPGNLVYGAYANRNTAVPNGQVYVAGADRNVNGTAQLSVNTWTHLSVTYDGAAIKLFVNGVQVATTARTGPITTSAGVLHIGGNTVWNEWFQGVIDEVRVYNRALTPTEIQADMATRIRPGSNPQTAASVSPSTNLFSTYVSKLLGPRDWS